MEEKDFNELMDLVPSHVINEFNLTQKQTIVLGQLIMLNGLDYQKENGYFYRSNKDLAEDCGVTTTGILKILNKLINCKLVERKTGNRKDGASLYKLNTNIFENNTNKIENIMKEQVTYQVTQKLPNELPIKIIDYLSDSLQVIDKLLNSYLTQLPNEVTHQVTSDTESDIDKEIDIYNKINNIKESINNNLNKINNNILNISESVVTTENENELDSTEFENEVEDNEEINDSIPSEDEINVEPVTVEDELDDTNTLTDEQLEARLINYFNEEKDTITNEHQLNEFETVFNMVLQNFKDNEQITNEQFNHARLFIVLPKLSELRYKLVQLKHIEKDTVEPSNEETLTTIQPSEENASEPKEMPLNQKNTNTVAKEEGGEAITLDFEEALKEDTETANTVHDTPADKLISYDDAMKTFIPRMHELYSQCNTKEDIQETYTTIIKGIEDFNSKGKFNSNTYNKLKSVAWESRAKYEIPIYRKAYEEKKANEAAESVSSVAA